MLPKRNQNAHHFSKSFNSNGNNNSAINFSIKMFKTYLQKKFVTIYFKLILILEITMGFRNTTWCLEKLNLTFFQ